MPVWLRNVQLGIFSIPQAAFLLLVRKSNRALLSSNGLLVGFTPAAWLVVSLTAVGGLLVAAVVKHADNILKTYATAIAIVLTCLATSLLSATVPSAAFLQGMVLVLVSMAMYNVPAVAQAQRTDSLAAEPRSKAQQ